MMMAMEPLGLFTATDAILCRCYEITEVIQPRSHRADPRLRLAPWPVCRVDES